MSDEGRCSFLWNDRDRGLLCPSGYRLDSLPPFNASRRVYISVDWGNEIKIYVFSFQKISDVVYAKFLTGMQDISGFLVGKTGGSTTSGLSTTHV